VFLRGKGAGPRPTASAVSGDVVGVLGRAARAESLAPGVTGAAVQGRRGQGERDHLIRVRGEPAALTPAQVLAAIDGHQVAVSEVGVGRTTAHILARSRAGDARACARALAGGDDGRVLVVPALGGTYHSFEQ